MRWAPFPNRLHADPDTCTHPVEARVTGFYPWHRARCRDCGACLLAGGAWQLELVPGRWV